MGPTLPKHVARSVNELAELHANHHQDAGAGERAIRRVTQFIARPAFLALFAGVLAVWVVANSVFAEVWLALDGPPFVYLELSCTILAVCIAVLVLVTQQRDDALAERREQLTLELAVLTEAKSAKIIELLEELRRDLPSLENRSDREAEAMAIPGDPKQIMDAIKTSHRNPYDAGNQLDDGDVTAR